MAKTAADMLVERLIDWGVKVIFGFPGDGINGIFEALRTHQDKIQFIQVRHEEAAAFAACGYAKYTGSLGVCMATSGPGGIHLLNGLYDAKCDGQPVLAITGHTFHDLIGTHYQQDVDLDKLFMDVAVYNERIMGPAHVVQRGGRGHPHGAGPPRRRPHLHSRRTSRTGPARDGKRSKDEHHGPQRRHLRGLHPACRRRSSSRRPPTSSTRARRWRSWPAAAAWGPATRSSQLAEKAAAPIVKPLLGKAVVPDDSPYTTGGIGLLGTAPSQDAMKGCDTLLIVGSSFPYMEFLPKPGQAKCVQIDVDPARIGLRYPADVGLVGDCRRILDALLPLVQRKTDRSFLEKAQKGMKEWNELMQDAGDAHGQADEAAGRRLAASTSSCTDDAIVVGDCGTVTTWAARYIDDARRHDVLLHAACWRRWPTACPTASGQPSPIPAGRSSASAATAASPCSWASWPRWSSTSCPSR